MTLLERKAAFRAPATLQQQTVANVACDLGVYYNHLTLVLKGEPQGSARLEQAVALLLGRPREEVFPQHGEN